MRPDELEREDELLAALEDAVDGRPEAAFDAAVPELGVHAQEERILAAERVAALVHGGPDLALGDADAGRSRAAGRSSVGDRDRLAHALDLPGRLVGAHALERVSRVDDLGAGERVAEREIVLHLHDLAEPDDADAPHRAERAERLGQASRRSRANDTGTSQPPGRAWPRFCGSSSSGARPGAAIAKP